MKFHNFRGELSYWLRRDLWVGKDAALVLSDVIPGSEKFGESEFDNGELIQCDTFSTRFDQFSHALKIENRIDCELALARIEFSVAEKIDLMRQDFERGEGTFRSQIEWIGWAIDKNYSINWLKHAVDMGFIIEIKERIDSSEHLRRRYYEPDSHYGNTYDEELTAPSTQTDVPNRSVEYPWGSHSTNLLTLLSAAAEKFWSRYDPTDPTTAPTNEQVKDWLIDRKVSMRIAEAMATILRLDGLPTGRRE